MEAEPRTKYKIEIDKELLFEAMILPNEQVNDTHLEEMKKVFEVIMVRYYSNWSLHKDDLYHRCLECAFQRKNHYDRRYPAYNFLFTMFRNETGNYIKKHLKDEAPLETDSAAFDADFYAEQPDFEMDEDCKVLARYEQYLTGATDYNFIRIPKDITIELVTSLLKRHKKAVIKRPKDLDADSLYTILWNIIK